MITFIEDIQAAITLRDKLSIEDAKLRSAFNFTDKQWQAVENNKPTIGSRISYTYKGYTKGKRQRAIGDVTLNAIVQLAKEKLVDRKEMAKMFNCHYSTITEANQKRRPIVSRIK